MKVGITATRNGLSAKQLGTLYHSLVDLGATELHHGDCQGGDAQADAIARALSLTVIIHPPEDPRLRAFCAQLGDIVWEPLSYLERNQDIVRETEHLIGLPAGPEPNAQRAGGTWYTIRFAKRLRRPITILYP